MRITERQRLALKLDSLNDGEVHEVLDYISIVESMRHERLSSPHRDDDLVSRLANATENRRARQAHEWEAARVRADRRAASLRKGA